MKSHYNYPEAMTLQLMHHGNNRCLMALLSWTIFSGDRSVVEGPIASLQRREVHGEQAAIFYSE